MAAALQSFFHSGRPAGSTRLLRTAAFRTVHTTVHVPRGASLASAPTTGEPPSGSTTVTLPASPSSHVSPSVFHDRVANKFVNCMMWEGKKTLSQRIFKEAMEGIKRAQIAKAKKGGAQGGEEGVVVDPMEVFHVAVSNARPIMGTTGVRRGGKLYHVPVALRPERQEFLAIRWLITAAREKPGKGMAKKLVSELLDAFHNQGTVIKRKQDLHRLAEANRAFAHFRW